VPTSTCYGGDCPPPCASARSTSCKDRSAGRDLLDASSSGEDVPRGLDFLLSRNRLNVAISRTQCIAYLVCSRRLLEVDCKTIEHMRLANALCRFVEIADAAVPGVSG